MPVPVSRARCLHTRPAGAARNNKWGRRRLGSSAPCETTAQVSYVLYTTHTENVRSAQVVSTALCLQLPIEAPASTFPLRFHTTCTGQYQRCNSSYACLSL